jgi:sortase A
MTATVTMPRPPTEQAPLSWGRRIVGVIGELMITAGLLLMLLVAYQLWWTNIESNHKASQLDNSLHNAWTTGAAIPKDAIGIMYIQRLGQSWEKPIVQGVDLDHLAEGVGHFTNSQMPGQTGNFAVAAHRATHGQPFAYLNDVKPGDKVVVETKTDYFVYVVDTMPGTGGKAWKLVDPNYGTVVSPVPEHPGQKATQKMITLVTCNPRWGHSTRLIVYGHQTQDYKKTPGMPLPAELAYTQGG